MRWRFHKGLAHGGPFDEGKRWPGSAPSDKDGAAQRRRCMAAAVLLPLFGEECSRTF